MSPLPSRIFLLAWDVKVWIPMRIWPKLEIYRQDKPSTILYLLWHPHIFRPKPITRGSNKTKQSPWSWCAWLETKHFSNIVWSQKSFRGPHEKNTGLSLTLSTGVLDIRLRIRFSFNFKFLLNVTELELVFWSQKSLGLYTNGFCVDALTLL